MSRTDSPVCVFPPTRWRLVDALEKVRLSMRQLRRVSGYLPEIGCHHTRRKRLDEHEDEVGREWGSQGSHGPNIACHTSRFDVLSCSELEYILPHYPGQANRKYVAYPSTRFDDTLGLSFFSVLVRSGCKISRPVTLLGYLRGLFDGHSFFQIPRIWLLVFGIVRYGLF
jgi:hypothetical protein